MNSSITLDIQANLDSLTKSIKAVNKSMKLDLGLNIKNALKEATKGLKEGLAQNKPIAELNELRNKIKEATSVQLKLKLDNATNQLKTIVPQALGTYYTFKKIISNPISASIDFNNSINEINKFTHFSKTELEGFKKDMFSLGKSNGMDLNDILKINELSAQLGIAKNDLKDFSQNAINLKIGLGLSKEEALDLSVGISKAFDLGIKDIQTYSDEVTAMSTGVGVSAKKILEVTKATASGAKAFKLSAKETSALSASFLSVGLDSSEASSSMNKFFTELNNIDNATEGFKQSLAKMGIDSQQLKEDIKNNPQVAIKNLFEDLNDLDDESRFGIISELFGKKMANNINSAKNGVEAFTKALESSKDSAGALKKAVEDAAGDGLSDSIIEFKNAWIEFKTEIGSVFRPALKWLADVTKNVLDGLTNFLKNHQWSKWVIGITAGIAVVVKSAGLIAVAWRPLGFLLVYPLQYLWKALVLSDMRFKISTGIANIYSLSIKKLGYSLKWTKTNLKLTYRSLMRFNYGLAISNTLAKINAIKVKGLSQSIFSIVTAFKKGGAGVTLFSKIFKIALIGIRTAFISTGIGAIIVGIGIVATWAINRYWKPLGVFFKGLFQGISEAITPLKQTFSALWQSIKSAFAPLAPLFRKIFKEVSNTQEELSSFAQAGLVVGKVIGVVISLIAKPFEYLIKAITLAFEWGGKLTSWLGDILGLGDDKKLEVNANKTFKGTLDNTLATQNENRAKMLSSNNDNSRQINDYKTITINTGANPQAVMQAINTNSYSFEDDEF